MRSIENNSHSNSCCSLHAASDVERPGADESSRATFHPSKWGLRLDLLSYSTIELCEVLFFIGLYIYVFVCVQRKSLVYFLVLLSLAFLARAPCFAPALKLINKDFISGCLYMRVLYTTLMKAIVPAFLFSAIFFSWFIFMLFLAIYPFII